MPVSAWSLAIAAALIVAFGSACGSSELEADPAPTERPASDADSTLEAAPVYLALGDSLAVGVGARDWRSGGYVPRLLESLNERRSGGAALTLVNVGRSGADTRSMIDDGQLAEAVAAIEQRRATESPADDVQVITIGVGGNDAFGLVPVCNRVIDEACLSSARQTLLDVQKNLLFILSTLREAAGPAAQIAVMTYYNPLIHESCPLHDFRLIGDVVLEGQAAAGLEEGLNDQIRAAAAAVAVPVAEVGELSVSDLTGDCLHASDAGHARIAAAFEVVLTS